MPPSSIQLGKKLRAARAATGKSTRTVAREATIKGIPMSHATLANYERGDTMPSLPTLKLLARIYECPLEQLMEDTPALSGIRYRALKSVRVSDRRHFEGEATRWSYVYFELETILGRPLRGESFEAKPSTKPADLAAQVRNELGLGDKPIPSVVRLLEKFGIRVLQVESTARIDGLAAMYGDAPVVALNPKLSSDRFRFNAAHELGHHLYEDWRDEDGKDHDGDDRAHEFASHLLIPDSKIEDAFEGFSMVRLVRYKELYGVSLAAMIYRGKQAELIEQKDYERIWREFGRLGWRKREPGFVPPDYSSRLEQLIERAIHDKAMSFGDVARLAAVDERVIQARVMEAIGGRLPVESEAPGPFSFPGRR